MLTVELVVTEQCNLNCKYCYMANRNKYMDEKGFDRFLDTVDFFLKKYNQKDYYLTFFGGEPLMNWDLIQYAVPKLKADKRCVMPNLVTNGLLLDESRLKWLRDNNVAYSWSFDGLWNEQFEKYLEKKDLFTKMTNHCKVMIMPKDVHRLAENFEWLVTEFGIPYPDFMPVRDDIWTKDDVARFDTEWTRLTDKNIELIKRGKKSIAQIVYTLDMIVNSKTQKRAWACFAGCKGVAYLPDGMYYPCARFGTERKFPLYDTVNNVVFEETINGLLKPQVSDPRSFVKCQSCSLYNVCNTGCQFKQIKSDLSASEPVAEVCDLLHVMYRESIRMFNELKGNPLYTAMIKERLANGGN